MPKSRERISGIVSVRRAAALSSPKHHVGVGNKWQPARLNDLVGQGGGGECLGDFFVRDEESIFRQRRVEATLHQVLVVRTGSTD